MKRGEREKNGPYQYSPRAVLKVQNGSLAPTKWSNKIGGLHTKGSFDIHALNIDLDAAMEHNGVVELVEIRGWVKSTHSKGTRQTFTLTAISIDQWEQRVESITTAEWKKYTGYIIESELVCTGRSGLRRSIQAVDGPAQSPSHRRTRTDRLEEQHAVVRDRNESLGEKMEQLITRWKCHSATCGHSGTCWIDEHGEYYRLSAVQRERWAIAIQNNETTEYQPPLAVYRSLVNQASSGGGSQSSQKGRKVSTMEQMKDLITQQMEFSMMKSMKSMANEESQQQSYSQHHFYPPQPPPPVYPYTGPHYPFMNYPNQSAFPNQSMIAHNTIAHNQPSPPPPHIPPISEAGPSHTATSQQRSSPIGGRSEEDDIIESFWQWKKETTSKQSRKLQVCQAQAKFEHEMWNLDGMRAMADTSSGLYKHAINSGLPDGLIRGLKADLKEFKSHWRETYQHARTLNTLGLQGGHQEDGFL